MYHRTCVKRKAPIALEAHRKLENRRSNAPSDKYVTVLRIVSGAALGAVFFLVQSMLSVFSEGEFNWYLPLALGLNCIALFLNAARQKNTRKHEA